MSSTPASAGPLNVVLCWHMHQPDYRYQDVYLRPWTWLHAIKDYSDMAAHLETVPGARAVVNFSPVLIEALQDYPRRIENRLKTGQLIGDAILDALAGDIPGVITGDAAGEAALVSLLRSLLRVNEARMKYRFPAYARLHHRAAEVLAHDGVMARQELVDLLIWYVLVLMGESLRTAPLPQALMIRETGFTSDDRRALLGWLGEEIGRLLPRYRALADSGRIELSVTPFAHPILPLLLDLNSAREAWPDVVLPAGSYPGGEERSEWHIVEARRVFRQAFGRDPAGCWPAEGGISEAAVRILSRNGFRWAASGARVLFNSLGSADGLPQTKFWRFAEVGCFFRDDGLSDLIGFEYSKWKAEDAVTDFIERLEQVRTGLTAPGEAVLSIIMDGENAWEYFDENGWSFLQALYRRLAAHGDFRLTTFSDAMDHIQPTDLPRLVAGSWVHGTFSTWIGEPAKNRAWELLIHAKEAVDVALVHKQALAELQGRTPADWTDAVQRQLAVCEASDWSWWLGDENRLEDGPAFDALYRQQLTELYALINREPPAELSYPINGVSSARTETAGKAGGAMRPADVESGIEPGA